jgi:hypothetical protein
MWMYFALLTMLKLVEHPGEGRDGIGQSLDPAATFPYIPMLCGDDSVIATAFSVICAKPIRSKECGDKGKASVGGHFAFCEGNSDFVHPGRRGTILLHCFIPPFAWGRLSGNN